MKMAVSRSDRNQIEAALRGAGSVALRGVAMLALIVMVMAEPIIAVVLGALSLGCFFVSVLFGFILHAPFQHRWEVFAFSIVFAVLYCLYRQAMKILTMLIHSRERR